MEYGVSDRPMLQCDSVDLAGHGSMPDVPQMLPMLTSVFKSHQNFSLLTPALIESTIELTMVSPTARALSAADVRLE